MSKGAIELVTQEYKDASSRNPRFASAHEGYAVLLEEVDELWDAIKADDPAGIVEEARQVGAMALRILVDVCGLPVEAPRIPCGIPNHHHTTSDAAVACIRRSVATERGKRVDTLA